MSQRGRKLTTGSESSSRPENLDRTGPRLTSPSPSVRHISHKRVNHPERLLSPKNIEYQSVYEGENQPLYIGSLVHMVHEDSIKTAPNYGATTSELVVQNSTEYQPLTDNPVHWTDLLPYYLPIFSWIWDYSFEYFIGDLVGGLSLVFFQLPLSLSYATSLAHVPVICGLFSLGIAPLVYLVFGSVPQMIVGPESAISLIVGQAVEPILHHNKKNINPIDLVVAISFVSGATLLGFGLGRFGFLDNVLSGSLLKGFISGVGIVMVINSSILMLGLTKLMKEISDDPTDMDIHSPFDKFVFLSEHYKKYDPLTFKISIIAFVSLIGVAVFKSKASRTSVRYADKLVYIPEILIMVVVSSWLCYKNHWDERGIGIIGSVTEESGDFLIHNPITIHQFKLMKKVSTAGFLCAVLGFFESTTASKSLGSTYNLPISSNRELVALGFINLTISLFGGLPAFGGYGRSKINAISAKSTMSGAIMGICTLLTVSFLLDWLYYIPKCILSVITAKIGLLLIDEAPYELLFHWKSRGYNELITFFVTVTTTIFFSMEAGIAVGLIYLLVRVIKHSAMSRIQILGRIPGTNTFVDADINVKLLNNDEAGGSESNEGLIKSLKKLQVNLFRDDHFTSINTNVPEEIEGCLIVKIPEPLTFTNTSDLRSRLKRVEMYGSTKAHPALKRSRSEEMTHYVIFDLRGMSELDSSAAQILKDLIIAYKKRHISSFFVRVSAHADVRRRLKNTGITDLLREDLEGMQYYQVQKQVSNYRNDDSQLALSSTQFDSAKEIFDLTEDFNTPYFEHIRDALKVIDLYEYRRNDSSDFTV